ncbi:MAG: hypothetical protein WB780_23970 [Candidatus Acidiferrales bacterium]
MEHAYHFPEARARVKLDSAFFYDHVVEQFRLGPAGQRANEEDRERAGSRNPHPYFSSYR